VIARGAVLIACAVAACRSEKTTMTGDDSVVQMRQELASARKQTAQVVVADALPQRDAVRELVAAHPDQRWAALGDDERFLLYELAPDARKAAPRELVARAYCAGLRVVPHEWWGEPDALTGAPVRSLLEPGAEAARCLRPLLGATDVLRYRKGETNTMVKEYGWTIGDLAAGLAAQLLAKSYDVMAPPEVRAVRRAELAQALDAMAGTPAAPR
jgi:hypothetical protein